MASEKQYIDGHLINYSSSNGYPTIWNGSKNILVHRYIWEKHNGAIPKGYEIHHKDKNRCNFDLNNLMLVETTRHHREHAIENGLGKQNKGKIKTHISGCCGERRKVLAYRDDVILFFESVSECSKNLDVSTGDICRILKGVRKSAKGWKFKYVRENL